MRIKPGVSVKGVQPETIIMMLVLDPICQRYGFELILTSVTDGKHGEGSLHPPGLAIDWRGKALSGERREAFIAECNLALGRLLPDHLGEFDIVDEHVADAHFHGEYDPD